jgi:hypothetical protein
MKRRYWWFKSDPKLKEELDKVRIERIKQGKDKRFIPYPRLGLAIARHEKLLKDLCEADFLEDKRGQIFNIFTIMITALLCVLLFGGLIYAQGIIYTALHNVGVQNDATGGLSVNMTKAADITFGTVNQSIQALRMVAVVYIMGLIAVFLITSALVRINPIWFFAYVLVVAFALMLSAPISNAYLTILQSGIYDNGLQSFTGANWILLNLPVIVLVLGMFGAVLLMINIVRQGGESDSL